METFRIPHHFARKYKFWSGCHINLVTRPDFLLVLSLHPSLLFTLNLFYALAEHKGGCMFFYEAVFAWIDRAQWNKLVWRGIYGMAEKRVQKGFGSVREEICVAITKNMVYHLLGHVDVALTRWCLEGKKKKSSFCVWERTWITPLSISDMIPDLVPCAKRSGAPADIRNAEYGCINP